MTCVASEDSDQPGHLPSLIRLCFAHYGQLRTQSFKVRGKTDQTGRMPRLIWVDAQADLSLLGAQVILLILSCFGSNDLKLSTFHHEMIKTFAYIIRIFHGCEVWIEKSVRGSLSGIRRLCRVMPNRDTEGWIFLSAPSNHDRFFFLHTFWPPAFDFNAGFATMTSTPNILTLCDLLHNQCIDKTCYSIFIYPTSRIRVCKIRFVRTGKNHRKPCLVCKNVECEEPSKRCNQ